MRCCVMTLVELPRPKYQVDKPLIQLPFCRIELKSYRIQYLDINRKPCCGDSILDLCWRCGESSRPFRPLSLTSPHSLLDCITEGCCPSHHLHLELSLSMFLTKNTPTLFILLHFTCLTPNCAVIIVSGPRLLSPWIVHRATPPHSRLLQTTHRVI